MQTRNFQAQPAPRCQQLRGVRQDHARHARRMLLPQRGLFLPETRATRSATLSCGAGRRVGTASGTPKQPCVGAGCQRARSHSPFDVLQLLTLLTDFVALKCARRGAHRGSETAGARRARQARGQAPDLHVAVVRNSLGQQVNKRPGGTERPPGVKLVLLFFLEG